MRARRQMLREHICTGVSKPSALVVNHNTRLRPGSAKLAAESGRSRGNNIAGVQPMTWPDLPPETNLLKKFGDSPGSVSTASRSRN